MTKETKMAKSRNMKAANVEALAAFEAYKLSLIHI